ncbi:IFM1 protein, partial [Oreocharis arfaki]|nr:IFM1 protein [Oreocharis arfaki]
CPRARRMHQSLPPYEVLPAEVSMEELPRSTTVMIEEPPRPPRDHLVWSFFTTLYCNFCCLGLLAFIFSVKVLGDYSGALSYGSTAKCLNIAALVINIIIVVIVVTVIAVIVTSTIKSEQHSQYGRDPFSGLT